MRTHACEAHFSDNIANIANIFGFLTNASQRINEPTDPTSGPSIAAGSVPPEQSRTIFLGGRTILALSAPCSCLSSYLQIRVLPLRLASAPYISSGSPANRAHRYTCAAFFDIVGIHKAPDHWSLIYSPHRPMGMVVFLSAHASRIRVDRPSTTTITFGRMPRWERKRQLAGRDKVEKCRL